MSSQLYRYRKKTSSSAASTSYFIFTLSRDQREERKNMDSRKKSVRNKQSVNVSASLSLNEGKETLSSSVATTDTTPCSLTPDECLSTSSPDLVKIPALDKYSLRPKSIKNRIEVELKRKAPVVKKTPKPKAKPVPLSKYRRRTANARERTRMQVKKFHSFYSLCKKKTPVHPLLLSFSPSIDEKKGGQEEALYFFRNKWLIKRNREEETKSANVAKTYRFKRNLQVTGESKGREFFCLFCKWIQRQMKDRLRMKDKKSHQLLILRFLVKSKKRDTEQDYFKSHFFFIYFSR